MTVGRGDRERGDGRTDRHVPVLLTEVLAALAPIDGETYVDATFGAGGYSAAILEAADCKVLALDRDPAAIAGAAVLRARFKDRLTVVESPFSNLEAIVRERLSGARGQQIAEPQSPLDGLVFDIGVSSMQLDVAERGFSFMHDGPLDMRMGGDGASAADIVNTGEENDIADILYRYGEERRSRAIARAIVERRKEQPLSRTGELAALVEKVIGRRPGDPKHPATRTFQALRIATNDELGELRRGLAAAERLLKPGGRLVVVTFHSLEDRIVKEFLRERSERAPRGSRHLPGGGEPDRDASFRFVNPRPLSPGESEVDRNPRARSARLRWAVRTTAPAFPSDDGKDVSPRSSKRRR